LILCCLALGQLEVAHGFAVSSARVPFAAASSGKVTCALPTSRALRGGGTSVRMASDCACTIVGAGRIGQALRDMGNAAGFTDSMVGRQDSIDAQGSGPVYVATRNDALASVIAKCPTSRKSDLVFYGQNGYIEDFLKEQGVFESSTKVLVYMAVAKLGEKPTDGITDLNPEGLTAATGLWADQVAARLRGAGLTCNVLNEDDFRASMFEKHMWISAFMLLGVHHGGTVGDVQSKHAGDLKKMVAEMMNVLIVERNVKFTPGVEERLLAYAKTVAHFPTALKEFEWRNQFWLDLTRARAAASKHDLTPFHTELLMKAKADGHVSFE